MQVSKEKIHLISILVTLIGAFALVVLLQQTSTNISTPPVANGPFTVSTDYVTLSENKIDFTIEYPKSWGVRHIEYYPPSFNTLQTTPAFEYKDVTFATLSNTELFHPILCPKMEREYVASNRSDTNIVIETCSICDTTNEQNTCNILNAQIYFIPGYIFTSSNEGDSVPNEIGFKKFHSVFFNGEIYQKTVFPDKAEDIKSILKYMAENIKIKA